MGTERRHVVVSARSAAVFVGIALAAVLALSFLYATRRVLVWILIALVFALALNHLVGLLERWLPRTAAALVTFFGALGAIGGAGYVLVPLVVGQATELVESIPDALERFSRGRGPLGDLEQRFGIVERVRTFVEEEGVGGAFGLGEPVLAAVTALVTTAIAVVAIVFLVLFMLVQGPRWKRGLLGALPERHRPLWERLADGIGTAVGGWVIGAVFVALLASGTALVVLLILGVDYPFALALIVALVNPIPFLGTPIAAVVVGTITLITAGLFEALVFLGFLIAYNQLIENHLLVPLVYGKTVRVSPLGVLVAVLLGGELAGIVGALLAIPISGAIVTVVAEVRAWRRLPRS